MKMKPVAVAAAALLLLASCDGGDTPESFSHPTAPDEAILQISYSGGGPPPGGLLGNLRSMPFVSLMGDGTLYRPGADAGVIPGVDVYRLSEQGIQTVFAEARAVGLMGDYEAIGPEVADAPTAYFSVHAGERWGTQIVFPHDEGDAQRQAIRVFEDRFRDVPGWLGVDAEVVSQGAVDRVMMIFPSLDDPAFSPQRSLEWTLPLPEEVETRLRDHTCFVLEGAELDAARPLLEAADVFTVFTAGDRELQVAVAPILPWTSPCA